MEDTDSSAHSSHQAERCRLGNSSEACHCQTLPGWSRGCSGVLALLCLLEALLLALVPAYTAASQDTGTMPDTAGAGAQAGGSNLPVSGGSITGYSAPYLPNNLTIYALSPPSNGERHWPPLQLNAQNTAATVVTLLGGSLANSAGVGGGGFFVPMFNILLGFDAKTATSLSQAMVTGGATTSFLLNVCLEHPSQHKSLIDYDIALLLEPMLLLGIGAGVLLNVLMPAWIIIILLTLVLAYMFWRTSRKGLDLWSAESRKKHDDVLRTSGGNSPTAINAPASLSEHQDTISVEVESRPWQAPKRTSVGRRASVAVAISGATGSPEEKGVPARRGSTMASSRRSSYGPEESSVQLGSKPVKDLTSSLSIKDLHKDDAADQETGTAQLLGAANASWDGDADVHGDTLRGSASEIVLPNVGVFLSPKTKALPPKDGSSPQGGAVLEVEGPQALPLALKRRARLAKVLPRLDSSLIPKVRLLEVLFIWLVFLAISFFKGGSSAHSTIGVRRCSAPYWVLVCVQVPLSLLFTGLVARRLWRGHCERVAAGNYESSDLQYGSKQLIAYPALALVAGVAAGLLGIGGGMVIAPLLLELGMLPQVTAATAAFMVLFSSSMAVAQFAILHMVPLETALYYGILCGVSAFFGVSVVRYSMNRWGRPSIIIFSLAIIIGVSALVIGILGAIKISQQIRGGEYMGFDSLCH